MNGHDVQSICHEALFAAGGSGEIQSRQNRIYISFLIKDLQIG
jgi:hypothetical protein